MVVTAWNRKEYLLQALKSVTEQTLSSSEYEVIVVKNFYDELIDGFIDKHGFERIYCDNPKLGYKYALALRQCSGEVVCPLEDDDLFHPAKLREIKDFFERTPSLGYVRNSLVEFRDQKELPGKPAAGDIHKDITIKKPRCAPIPFHKLETWNNSSCSIRREILVEFVDELREIELAVDLFLFAAAYMANSAMMFSSKVLTYFRVHHQQTTNLQKKTDFNDFLKKRAEIFKRMSVDWKIMENMCKDTLFEEHCKLSRKNMRLVADIFGGSRGEIIRSVLDFSAETLAGAFGLSTGFESLKFLVDPSSSLYRGLLGVVSPRYARKLYYRRVLSKVFQ